MTERRVLVTGSTGALGPAVVDAFRESGWTVQTMSRVEIPGNRLHFTGDITDTDLLRRAAGGVESIVHLAALLHIVDPSFPDCEEQPGLGFASRDSRPDQSMRAGMR